MEADRLPCERVFVCDQTVRVSELKRSIPSMLLRNGRDGLLKNCAFSMGRAKVERGHWLSVRQDAGGSSEGSRMFAPNACKLVAAHRFCV